MYSSFFNEYDIVVLIIVLTSSLLSLIRGFIREFFSLFAWLGAGAITFLYFSKAAAILSNYFDNKMVVSALAIICLYLLSLIAISFLNMLILDFSREVRLGAIDRILGLAFGFARGVIIASILHFVIVLVQGDKGEPAWLLEAKTYNVTSVGASMLKNLASGYVHDIHFATSKRDALYQKLTSVFTDSLSEDSSHSTLEQQEIFRKILKGLPKKDQEKLNDKLDRLGATAEESDIAEIALETLVLYRKADRAGMVKNKLKDDELDLVDNSIKNLQKNILNDTGLHKKLDQSLQNILSDKKDKEDNFPKIELPKSLR